FDICPDPRKDIRNIAEERLHCTAYKFFLFCRPGLGDTCIEASPPTKTIDLTVRTGFTYPDLRKGAGIRGPYMPHIIITHAGHDGTGAYMTIGHDGIVRIARSTAKPGCSSGEQILSGLEKRVPPSYPALL